MKKSHVLIFLILSFINLNSSKCQDNLVPNGKFEDKWDASLPVSEINPNMPLKNK